MRVQSNPWIETENFSQSHAGLSSDMLFNSFKLKYSKQKCWKYARTARH